MNTWVLLSGLFIILFKLLKLCELPVLIILLLFADESGLIKLIYGAYRILCQKHFNGYFYL